MAEEPGHAHVELWLGQARGAEQGERVIPAVVSMAYEKGWHGYWINPGEGGVSTTMRWQLPAGVEVSDLMFPVPHRAMTGGLACYGYEGSVKIAFEIRVTPGVAADATIAGELRWLACDEKSCVPGKVSMSASLAEAGKHASREEAIAAAHAAVPRPAPELRLEVSEKGNEVLLTIEGGHELSLQDTEFFPATEQVLDPKQPLRWSKTASGYQAKAVKNEYAEGALDELKLLIVPPKSQPARWVEWKKS